MTKKIVILSIVALAMSDASVAQDDMYFVPKKKDKTEQRADDYGLPSATYYSGSDRDVDEYNRHGSYVQPIDSAGNDVIVFDSIAGVYPDSVSETQEDYTYTRRMSRFDDYEWLDSYWAGYYDGRWSRWGWYDPWYYGSWYYGYYDPWYYGYYSPWYYGWAGWYGWYGWHGHWWGHPTYVAYHRGPSGTLNHISGTGRRPLAGYSGSNSISSGISSRDRTRSTGLRNRSFNASERFGSSRNTYNRKTYSNNQSRSNSSYSSGSSFGGSRSGGSFSGSRSSGGGSRGGFGGRR